MPTGRDVWANQPALAEVNEPRGPGIGYPMLTDDRAKRYAHEWLAAWNAHDVERVLAPWHEQCVFRSPLVVRVTGDASATVRGKAALRTYWTRALGTASRLHFKLDTIFVGHDSVVLGYRNHRSQVCAEWHRFADDGATIEGAAHYSDGAW
jgi:ketosteroid isomerase-like protein